MAKIRNVTKTPAVMEDLAVGQGTVLQKRGTGNKIDLHIVVESAAALASLDTAKYTRARVYSGATLTDYVFENGVWQVLSITAVQVLLNTTSTVQSFVDSFALKVFQSPTSTGLTEIQTRTASGSEVYEVRSTLDGSLATIYSDASGLNKIPQDSSANVSNSDGVVSFYIASGFYSISSSNVTSKFSVDAAKFEWFRDQVSSFLSLLGQKPDYSEMIKSKVSERITNRFGTSVAGKFGGADGEVVIGNIKNHQGIYLEVDPYFMCFTPSANLDVHSLSLTASVITGSLSGVSAKVVGFSALSGTIVEISTMTESAGVFSGSYTSDGTYDFIGLKLEYTPTSYSAGEKLGLSGLSLKVNSEEKANTDLNKELVLSVSSNNSINFRGYLTQNFEGFSVVHYGVYTGKQPRAFFVSPSGKNVPSGLSYEYSGDSQNDKLSYRSACAQMRVMAANGFESPAVIYDAGEYPVSGLTPIYTDDSSVITDAIFACPEGEARFLANGTNSGVVRCGTNRSESGYLNLYLLNITTDDEHDRPTIFQTCNIYALGCKVNGAGSTREGWELLSCNYYLQECEARYAGNDGFNSHDYLDVGSYGVLVDCISEYNGDDGFSPHERTNYEVWGGSYRFNGKGNIIPAFGARGFCVRVKSSGVTGLSPRVVPTDWGGFVALSADSNKQQTVMWCVECESDGDTHGFNSAGDLSRVVMINCTTKNNESGLRNSSWFTTQGGDAGDIKHIGTVFENNTDNVVLDDISKYLAATYI